MKKNPGFSLVELMIVVMIISILAIVALPSYKKYSLKAKVAEAYTTLGNMERQQITYFGENNEFVNVLAISSYIGPTATTTCAGGWTVVGCPVPIGTHTDFQYRAPAGKVDSSGATISGAGPSVSGYNFTLPTLYTGIGWYTGGTFCNAVDPYKVTSANFGAVAQANSWDWVFLQAVADLNGDLDTKCMIVGRVVQAKASNDRKPGSDTDFLVRNYLD